MLGVFAFALGASVGSFLNVVSDRMPKGVSIVTQRSSCDNCDRTLHSWELVPVFSYLWLRGKCSQCGTTIPVRVWLVELFTALLFTVAYIRYGFSPEFVVVSAAVALMVVVGLIDLEHKLILNSIVYPSIVILLILAPFWNELGFERFFLGGDSLVASLINSVISGAGAFLMFLAIGLAYPKGMGGGDIKLAGLIGLMVGFPGVIVALWLAVIVGGVVAIALLALRLKGRKDEIPFGPYLTLGAIFVLLAGPDVVSDYQELPAKLIFWT